MRLLVCGGRTYSDRATLFAVLDEIHAKTPVDVLIHGGAPGADFLGAQWAYSRGVMPIVYVAQWGLYGKAAGPRRNQQMLDEGQPQLLVSFTGGRGTLDMIARAKKAGVRHVAVGKALP